MPPKRPFVVIEGTPAPDTPKERILKRKRAGAAKNGPPEMLRCRFCASIAMLEIKLGMEFRNGRAVGGQKQVVCATCFAQGRTTIMVG